MAFLKQYNEALNSQGLPQGHTSFVIIHGIGEQTPFECLDSFTRGVVEHLNSRDIPFEIAHKIIERKERDSASRIDSFVRLSPEDNNWKIDIHEYYWAHLTEEKISIPEIWQWLEQTLRGTVRFYQQPENQKLLDEIQEENRRVTRNQRKQKKLPRWFLRNNLYSWFRLSQVLWRVRFVYPVLRVALFLIPSWPYLKPLLALRKLVERQTTRMIVGYIGDIAIYTTMDRKSRYYRIRQKILSEAQALLESILEDEECDRIIVAGHSLGSVIAHDTLNRLNIKANLEVKDKKALQFEKLQGLITFGSPLDKVAFFFREQLGGGLSSREKQPNVRRQILNHLHSFRRKSLTQKQEKIKVATPVESKLDCINWINYYNLKDPISGRLHFYNIPNDKNVPLDLPEPWGEAHNGYWDCEKFYSDIVHRFLLS